MMTARLVWIGIGALLCLAGVGQAQIPTSTQDRLTTPGPPPKRDVVRGNEELRHMARCVAERQATRVENLLKSAPGSKLEADLATSLQSRMDNCLKTDSISFTTYLLRGGLAEVLYQREFPQGLPAAKPAAEIVSAWVEPRLNERGSQALELMHSAARCLVTRQPERVSELLAMEAMTPAEMRVIRTLQDDLGACLIAGMTFNGNRQSLRALLAEAALEYGRAQRDGFAAVTGGSGTK